MKRLREGTARVVQAAQVGQIRLVDARCSASIRTGGDIPHDAQLSIATGARVAQPLDAEACFRVQARVDVRVSSEAANQPQLVLIEAVFEILYRLPPELRPSEEDLDEFADANGLFNAWPYLRQFVADTSQRMEIPTILLPLYRATRDPHVIRRGVAAPRLAGGPASSKSPARSGPGKL